MNILYDIHLYYPRHAAGGESYIHTLALEMIKRGHAVKVILNQANQHKIYTMYEWEGVMVFPPDQNIEESLYRWADIVVTHLDYTKKSIWKAAEYKKPCFHVVHNCTPYQSVIDGVGDIRIIYNSDWIAKKLQYQKPSFTFIPPLTEWYRTIDKGRKYITLINLADNKGSKYFFSWAKKLPQYQFLGIVGSYDNQHSANLPPNVTIWPNTPDIRKVYEVTKILCVPSHYESWGRVASEAMINGIPVIASPTDGLKENLDYAGIFANRKDSPRVMEEITKLMEEPDYYKKWSDLCLKRAGEQIPDWDGLENFLLARE
jgi:glycosyltransferase involved in cell wall biosynthesis